MFLLEFNMIVDSLKTNTHTDTEAYVNSERPASAGEVSDHAQCVPHISQLQILDLLCSLDHRGLTL